jgi:hypothetical protein
MSWFRHHYYCESCDGTWLAETELVVESDCPFCGERDTFPYKSDDWTLVIDQQRDRFAILEAKPPRRAGDYRRLKSFPTRAKAEAFVAARRSSRRKPAA